MVPFFHSGDVVEVRPVDFQSLKNGNVVLFSDTKGKHIVHRVLLKKEEGEKKFVITRGDNCSRVDGETSTENIIGKVVGRVRRNTVYPITRTEEYLGLFLGSLIHKLRNFIIFRIAPRLLNLLHPAMIKGLLPIAHIEVGNRRMTTIRKHIIAIRETSEFGETVWVHPLLRRIKKLSGI